MGITCQFVGNEIQLKLNYYLHKNYGLGNIITTDNNGDIMAIFEHSKNIECQKLILDG